MKFEPLFLAAVLLFAVAFDFHREVLWLDQNRIGQVTLLLMIGLVALAQPVSVSGRLAGFGRAPFSALALFLTLGLASTALAAEPEWAGLEWATVVLLLLLVFRVAHVAEIRADRVAAWLRVMIASVALVVALKVLMGYAAALVEGVRLDTLLLFEGTFSNRRFFGQLATLLIPLLAWAAWTCRRLAAGWFVLLAGWWMLVFVSGTRGSWLALAVGHVAMLMWAGRRAWSWGRLQFLGATAGMLAYALLFYGVPAWLGLNAGVENRLDNLSGLTSLSAREVIWGLAWQHALAHPWLGIGPMHFAAFPNPVAAHPHNAVLQLAAEWGFPAMLAAAFLAAYGLWAFVRPLRGEAEPLRLALAVSLAGAAIQSMVDGVLVIPYTQTWLAVIAGLALGLHFRGRVLAQPAPWGAWAIRGLSLLALAALLYGVVPEIFNRAEATAAYLESHDALAPRYWAQGWIR